MNNIFKFFIFFLFLFPSLASAGFDFGGDEGGCDGGSGNFQQQINYYGGVDTENAITVGSIPSGLIDVSIALKSSQDVDIRLYALPEGDLLPGEMGEPVVHWPSGLLSGAGSGTIIYQGVTIKYSGYNGDGTGLGHEYIKITGTTNTSFVMKAFGYAAGFAEVDYSWAGKANCTGGSTPSASGSGDFEQQIIQNDIVTVGDIPPGINNLYITLKSSNDVDIQLYDKDNGIKIIGWPDGRLNGSSQQSITYQGMQIEWSGYDGDGTGVGHEYIKITGLTTLNLTMKAFGYQAGFAEVHYEWGTTEVEEFPYQLSINDLFQITRTGQLGDASLTWVIEKNGGIALEVNATSMLQYRYFSNTQESSFRIWLKKFVNGQYEVVSNTIEYKIPKLTLASLSLTIDSSFKVRRTGHTGDQVIKDFGGYFGESFGAGLTWVIEKDGVIILKRIADDELALPEFVNSSTNTPGSHYRVWVEGIIGGSSGVVSGTVSNILEYTVPHFSLTIDESFEITRSGQLGDDLAWVIEKNGNVVLQRNAANELKYTYFSNTVGSSFRVWLEQFINGQYEIVSNIVEYEVN